MARIAHVSKETIYDRDLPRRPANYTPLTPVDFLARSASVYPDKVAVIHGDWRITYRELAERSRRLAAALAARGVGRGDTVSIMAPNVPAMLEAHYGVPLCGAVLNAINVVHDERVDVLGFLRVDRVLIRAQLLAFELDCERNECTTGNEEDQQSQDDAEIQ